MDLTEALAEIEALKAALEDVADALLILAEQGLLIATEQPIDGESIAEVFSEIMALCSFQDLAGQRLSRLKDILCGGPADDRPDAQLLNGPANHGGLNQAAADALFDDR